MNLDMLMLRALERGDEETVAALTMLQERLAADAARERDAQYPDVVPEAVEDAAYAAIADWYTPGVTPATAPVLVASFVESVTKAVYRKTMEEVAG